MKKDIALFINNEATVKVAVNWNLLALAAAMAEAKVEDKKVFFNFIDSEGAFMASETVDEESVPEKFRERAAMAEASGEEYEYGNSNLLADIFDGCVNRLTFEEAFGEPLEYDEEEDEED